MYKKLFIVLIIALPFAISACKKDSTAYCGYSPATTVAPATEIANLKAYLDANSLPYTQHPSGIFYNIVAQGSGETPDVCSTVKVKYVGRLTNGVGFDSSYNTYPSGISFKLGGLITGWQIGIPLIQPGGSIKLYVPPSLGYGSSAYGPIPGNSNLIFNIDLVGVSK